MSRIVVPVEVYSRVSGYFRPLAQWNKGKKEEFSQRKGLIYSSAPGEKNEAAPVVYDKAQEQN